MTFTTMTFTTNTNKETKPMSYPIDINATQLLSLAALAIAGGVAIGIAIGINLYSRCGRNG